MELEQKSISYCRPQLAETSICTETTDCIVPDTFPDVGRVVFACGSVTASDRSAAERPSADFGDSTGKRPVRAGKRQRIAAA